jgi:DNA-binding HxlR family transcriptional regulator
MSTDSPLAWAVARVGDRWTLLIVHALLGGPRRFSQLQDDVPDIAPNILSHRLKHLKREGVVVAHAYCVRPPRFAYQLSAAGRELAGALRLLSQWGAARSEDVDDALHHGTCGTALEACWWCSTCERRVDDREGSELRFV